MDKSFQGQAEQFERNIYGTPKGVLRKRLLWQDILKQVPMENESWSILDCGGGTGDLAGRLSKMGHRVTLNDLSRDMLEKAQEAWQPNNLGTKMEFIEGAFQDLPSTYNQAFDLVLCHAVFEWLADPIAALAHLKRFLKPNGWLSLMFYNKHGLVFHKVLKNTLFPYS